MKDTIERLLKDGVSYREIERQTGCSKGTIGYHARSLGISKGKRPEQWTKYNWDEIQQYHNAGHPRKECEERFFFSYNSWLKAVKHKRIITDEGHIQPNSDLIGGTNRFLGFLDSACNECGITAWQDKPLPMRLVWHDSDKNHKDIANRRILCPNCYSQTLKTVQRFGSEVQLHF